MNSIKCRNCGLTNFSCDAECRRCGRLLTVATPARPGTHRISAIVSLVIFGAVVLIAYYIFLGVRDSVHDVDEREANRLASQPQDPDAGLSRAERDRRRAERVGNAVNISPALSEHQKRTKDTEKMVEQLTNTSQNK